ncbi:hypothetical protein P3S67_030715 [Capsicum chacoense]
MDPSSMDLPTTIESTFNPGAQLVNHDPIPTPTTTTTTFPPPQTLPPPQHQPPSPDFSSTHPDYAELITAAITALREKEGSSRIAIAKYIDRVYSNLPPNHSALLTHHLKRLKNSGYLAMIKHSYVLAAPGSAPPPASAGGGPYAAPESQNYSNLGAESVFVSLGLADGPVGVQNPSGSLPPATGAPAPLAPSIEGSTTKRRPGRPRKDGSSEAKPVQPKSPVPSGMKKRPGRPPKTATVNASIFSWISFQPFSTTVKKARKLSGKPLGRPKKNVTSPAVMDPKLVVAYEEVKGKLDHMQSRIREIANGLRPCINSETPTTALAAFQELEELAAPPAGVDSMQEN